MLLRIMCKSMSQLETSSHHQPKCGEQNFEIQGSGDLWLMNRKVSINQVVVEVNYVGSAV